MGWLILLVVVIALLAAMAVKLKPQGQHSERYPYNKKQVLFSPAERSFLGVLDQAVGGDYRVFGKVRVADVVGVNQMADRSARQRAFNKISAKHILAVSPDYHRRGYGKMMMDRVESALKAMGCSKLNIVVRSSNEQVLEFYSHLGYALDDVVGLGKRLIPDA